jgi:hypothetical protein
MTVPLHNATTVCYYPLMTEALKNFFKGMASTMEVCPSDPPQIEKGDLEYRIEQSFLRTGASISESISLFDQEQSHREQAA